MVLGEGVNPLPLTRYVPLDRAAWQAGAEREIGFWRYWIAHHAAPYVDARPLRPDLARLLPAKRPARVLDAGAGAISLIGQADGVEVTSCDALADTYRALWAELGQSMPRPIEQQDMTALSYPSNAFDLVFCSNSLDHCHDPRAAVRELARVCAIGGCLYLRHFWEAARLGHYGGLHQWNVTRNGPREGVTVWRRMPAGNGFRLADVLPGVRTVLRRDVPGEGTRIVARWQKGSPP
jgi:SAM-dependent methyltransferase